MINTVGICGWINPTEPSSIPPQALLPMTCGSQAVAPPVALSNQGWITAYGCKPNQWTHGQFDDVYVLIKGNVRYHRAPQPPAASGQPLKTADAVAASFREHGARAVEQLLGPFALVLFDRRKRRVLLAIDRSGIERLCFSIAGPVLVFGTSALSVCDHPLIGRTIDQQAIFNYLFCHMVPSPGTIFSKVQKLEPAQVLQFDGISERRSYYWKMSYAAAAAGSTGPTKSQLIASLRESVHRSAQDGSTGAFLSGGTDSSTVAGLLKGTLAAPPKTFSMGFAAEGFDEMEYARIASKHFGTEPHEYYVTPQDVVQAIPLIAAAYDEPFGNASAVPTYFCAKLAKDHGMDALLAGDGGDEIFGGNARYAKQMIFEPYRALPRGLRTVLESVTLPMPFPAFLVPLRKLQSYIKQAKVPLPDRLETYNFMQGSLCAEVLNPDYLHAIDPLTPLKLMRQSYESTASLHPVDRMMHMDLKFVLADNDLRKVSRMCEVAGIDVRFPFLDEGVVELSGNLAPRQKVKGGQLRVFFKQALNDFLPREILHKTKHGFGLPFGLWLNTDAGLQALVTESLSGLARRRIVNEAYLDVIIKQHKNIHPTYYGVLIWVLVQLELWLQRHSGK
ncbi:MAG: asparagine synthetase B family protein [Burkholderiales bacterium]